MKKGSLASPIERQNGARQLAVFDVRLQNMPGEIFVVDKWLTGEHFLHGGNFGHWLSSKIGCFGLGS